ncbi:MAG: S53 family peptidase, partial [Thermoplasmata archaeon]
MPRSTRVGRRGRAWATALVLLACLAVALPSATLAAGSPTTGGAGTNGTLAAAAVLPSSFGDRSGYSEHDLTEVANPIPAVGTQNVVVSFEPSSPAFYAAPAPGTAPMSAAEVASAYGLTPTNYTAAEQYFEARGLRVLHAWPDRLSLSLTGTTAAIDRAFSTSLVSGLYQGRLVTVPGSVPSLPVSLAAEVASVAGLSSGFDSFTVPEVPAALGPGGGAAPAQSGTNLVTPTTARSIYDISGLFNLTSSPTYATGKGIVLLLWGLGYDPSDLQTFFSDYYPSAFPRPTVQPFPVDGAPAPSANAPNDPSNGSREMTLDLEWAGSMAPGATLDAVYAPAGPASEGYSPSDASMIDALNTAVDPSTIPNVAVISMSFGSADGQDPTLTNGFENDFSVAAHEGISLFAATGDTGGDAGSGCTGGSEPEYPSTSPQVIAVGGTSVTLDRGPLGGLSGFSETAWSDGGGGYSTQFAAPSWQEVGSGAGPISANGHRGTPDVAATAGYNFLYFNGGPAAGAGTSFATPLWAGMVAEMDALRGTNFGFVTPSLYELAAYEPSTDAGLNDITSGANCLGHAGPGWDTATGWGSPVGVFLYERLVSSIVNISVSASPSPVAPGGSVSASAEVTNSTSGARLANLSAVVSLTSTGLGGPCSGTFGTQAAVTDASGRVIATLDVPDCYLGSHAQVTVTVSGDGYYGTANTIVSVNLLGLSSVLAPLAQYPNNLVLYIVIMGLAVTVGAVLGRPRAPAKEPIGPPPPSETAAAPSAPAPP